MFTFILNVYKVLVAVDMIDHDDTTLKNIIVLRQETWVLHFFQFHMNFE